MGEIRKCRNILIEGDIKIWINLKSLNEIKSKIDLISLDDDLSYNGKLYKLQLLNIQKKLLEKSLWDKISYKFKLNMN